MPASPRLIALITACWTGLAMTVTYLLHRVKKSQPATPPVQARRDPDHASLRQCPDLPEPDHEPCRVLPLTRHGDTRYPDPFTTDPEGAA